ncbi:hypothetical protein FRC06_004787, partial [Ceratobasidium sp. 370]
MAEQQGNPPGPHPPLPPGLVPIQLPEIDYAHLSTLVADQVIESFDGRFDQLQETEKKRKERCGHLQRVITKLMLSGLHVAKVDEIGSANQPGPLDLDNDDEPPWEIDFSKSPDHTVNKEMVKQGRLWNGKEIPKALFKPEYHSDSKADPAPDLGMLERPMTFACYTELRNGATYEMITPGWRSEE